jgi:hypothetical protein
MRCYLGLLRVYPRAFRTEFGDLLCQAFGDLTRRAIRKYGAWGLIALWLRTFPDLIASAISMRFRADSGWSFRFRWIVACTTGALAGVIFMFGVEIALERICAVLGIPVFPRSDLTVWIMVLQFGASFGLVLGGFQSLAFEWKRSSRIAWMLVTMFGAALAVSGVLMVPITAHYMRATIHPFADGHPFLFYEGSAALCASVLGMLQTFVLARMHPRAWGWVPVSALGIVACAFLLETVMGIMRGNHYSLLVNFSAIALIAGPIYGALTGRTLDWIIQPGIASEIPSKTSDAQ